MKEAVMKVIDTLTQEDLHGAFRKLLERYNKGIATRGDYFEGNYSFMYVLSIPIEKSLETYLMILVYTASEIHCIYMDHSKRYKLQEVPRLNVFRVCVATH